MTTPANALTHAGGVRLATERTSAKTSKIPVLLSLVASLAAVRGKAGRPRRRSPTIKEEKGRPLTII